MVNHRKGCFHGVNGIEANRRTRIRDQERAPVASDFKRIMRKVTVGEGMLALTAVVSEGHRQADPRPGTATKQCVHHESRYLQCRIGLIVLVPCCIFPRRIDPVSRHHVAQVGCG